MKLIVMVYIHSSHLQLVAGVSSSFAGCFFFFKRSSGFLERILNGFTKCGYTQRVRNCFLNDAVNNFIVYIHSILTCSWFSHHCLPSTKYKARPFDLCQSSVQFPENNAKLVLFYIAILLTAGADGFSRSRNPKTIFTLILLDF